MALSIAQLGEGLVKAGRLETKPVCVHGAKEVEEDWVRTATIDRCLAKVLLHLTLEERPPAYLGQDSTEGCCGGGIAYMGFSEFPPRVRYFVSTGSPDGKGGAEYLKRSPEHVDAMLRSAGKITPLAKHIVFRRCQDLEDSDPGVRAIICFGTAEQIRNLCALNSFGSSDIFGAAIIPSGSACASLVTYPTGMSSSAPKESVFVGPVDPTGNSWFPECYMGMGIPIDVARRMVDDIDASFVVKRPKVAYPQKRETL